MVEQEQLASSVSVWWDARPKSVIWFQPNSVATEKLEFVEKRLFEILKEVASNPLNMDYMKDCVRRERRQLKFQAESSSEFFSTNVIHDFLFGRRGENSTFRDLKTLDEYDVLESWSDEQWRDFLRKWIVDAPHVSILGKPSKAKAEQLKADEVARLAARKEELGEEGLKALAKKLEDAKAKNDAPIPEGMIEAFPVPDVSTIHFIDTKTARSGLARKLGGGDQSTQELIDAQRDGETDLFVQFQDIPTNFVRINMLLGTSKIPLELKPLLPLFIDNFFNTPVMHEGKQLPFEDVVTELEKDTVAYSFGGAGGWADAEGLVLTFQVEPEKYEKAIQWIHKLSFESIFDETRLNAGLSKILADLPDAKRSGSNMMYATSAMVHLDPASAAKARNTLVKAVYLKRIKKILKKEPERVITMLEQLRKALFMPDNMRIAVTADIEKLSELGFNTSVYSHLLKDLPKPTEVNPIVKQYQLLSEAGRNPGSTGAIIVPMSTIDSSFALASAKGPTDYNDPTIPALLVAVSYLDAVEGPMWRAIRGTGLAYGTGFSRDLDGGFMQFRVYRSPDAHKAFAMAKRIVGAFVSGEAPFEKSALEGAVSSIVVGVADEAATMAQAAAGEFVNSVVRGVGKDYNSQLLKNVRKVTVAEIQAAMEAVLMPIFDPATADVFLTCAVVMEEVSCPFHSMRLSSKLLLT
jgi:Zn-dependent M16 (insulinase) family peptidase